MRIAANYKNPMRLNAANSVSLRASGRMMWRFNKTTHQSGEQEGTT